MDGWMNAERGSEGHEEKMQARRAAREQGLSLDVDSILPLHPSKPLAIWTILDIQASHLQLPFTLGAHQEHLSSTVETRLCARPCRAHWCAQSSAGVRA